jgi:N-dimethylarginine dimethylaminohydrolase
MTPHLPPARFLMCRPEHFAVSYAINPWMDPADWARAGRVHADAAAREWAALYRHLVALGAEIDCLPAEPGLPDLVFTANAAVVLDRKALLARFRHPERRGEEAHIEAMFRRLQGRGLIDMAHTLPNGITLEGAGDCVFDAARNLFWMGFGTRSDRAAREIVAAEFGVETLALQLADARFYHMDTALCPLPGGEVIYVPGAFTDEGLAAIHARVAPGQRIALAEKDASVLAANAVALGRTLLLSDCSERLRLELAERGYRVVPTPLGAFRRSGGSAFCLTLRLDRRSAAGRSAASCSAAARDADTAQTASAVA